MFLQARSKTRPYHWGPFPLEALARDPQLIAQEAARPPLPAMAAGADGAVNENGLAKTAGLLAKALQRYHDLFMTYAAPKAASALAPVPADLERRAADIKGGCYFLNASQVGICHLPQQAWRQHSVALAHSHAIVIMVAHGRRPETDNLAHGWLADAVPLAAEMRAAEIAVCVAGYIAHLGWQARAHSPRQSALAHDRLAVLAGLARRRGADIVNPFLDQAFALAVVSTDYETAVDTPLQVPASGNGVSRLHYWFGIGGAVSGRERARQMRRRSEESRYPMEQVKRVKRPTTLILESEVPRVPKRAAFFERALKGDLGKKSQTERRRFATKHPFSMAMTSVIRNMVPLQDGPIGAAQPGYDNEEENARAIKSLAYHLGVDLVGICEIPDYAWFSHHADGRQLDPYHRYAVVMLIDQEFDTMEGASGDDWISGAQSMRGYMRGAEIAGIMAEMLRDLGISARPQTNLDSDVLHIPLVLWAGLGELSRIGELVLNPFVGPRFKSVVLTTDMPLHCDSPIDFGLQYFCNRCLKCARECPCDAIPWGDKVMFNGYEMWKPDVERCTRYRVTNTKGSACGRCMKTCPINKVVDADGPLLTRIGSWLGINAMWAKPALVPVAVKMDDALGNGRRNAAKKWWLDLELVDDRCVEPKGTNQRDIDPERETKMDPAKQKIAYYCADAMPPGNHMAPWPLDRKAALAAAADIETPGEAAHRVARNEPPPAHYRARPAGEQK